MKFVLNSYLISDSPLFLKNGTSSNKIRLQLEDTFSERDAYSSLIPGTLQPTNPLVRGQDDTGCNRTKAWRHRVQYPCSVVMPALCRGAIPYCVNATMVPTALIDMGISSPPHFTLQQNQSPAAAWRKRGGVQSDPLGVNGRGRMGHNGGGMRGSERSSLS